MRMTAFSTVHTTNFAVIRSGAHVQAATLQSTTTSAMELGSGFCTGCGTVRAGTNASTVFWVLAFCHQPSLVVASGQRAFSERFTTDERVRFLKSFSCARSWVYFTQGLGHVTKVRGVSRSRRREMGCRTVTYGLPMSV